MDREMCKLKYYFAQEKIEPHDFGTFFIPNLGKWYIVECIELHCIQIYHCTVAGQARIPPRHLVRLKSLFGEFTDLPTIQVKNTTS